MEKENIAETVLGQSAIPETVLQSADGFSRGPDSGPRPQRVLLNPGQTIASKYVVIDRLGYGGAQATVYVARREGRQCVIKMYYRGYRPSEEFVRALRDHACPYVAELQDYGYENGSYYEIYQYYGNGTLEDRGRCSVSFIKDVVVPCMNEGLRFLHTLGGKGIVHGDIKPGNIFVSDDETRVIIGDFGISAYLDEKGRLIDEIRGTPEYAPRTLGLFGQVTKTPAYDYGALGLVLVRLAMGRSLFEGLSVAQIAAMWEDGIVLPDSMDGRLRRLVAGLLTENEQQRFGYTQVKGWCEGEFLQVAPQSIYTKEDFLPKDGPEPLIFGIFDNRIVTVSTLDELADAMETYWEHAKKQMRRSTFYEFLGQFDKALEQEVRVFGKLPDTDAGVFYALYTIRSNPALIYKGVRYATAKEFVDSLGGPLSGGQMELVQNGLFEFFLKRSGYDGALIARVHEIVALEVCDAQFIPQALYYLFSSEKGYAVGGAQAYTLHEFIAGIAGMDVDRIEQLTHDTRLLAWLYSLGFERSVLKLMEK